MQNVRIRLLFALFAASGCTGLIYESVWTHYLKLFIGTAAFAQSFVLVVFMGGLAFGAWLTSRWSARFPDPLVAYAAIEALIGLAALGFHELYTLSTAAALDHVIPALGSPLAVEVFKYGLCTILIAPQTVLLGMTFPLMSTAVIRREPQRGGHHLAMLYFTNSIGAAIGALAAAFWLLGWLGMPGTMRAAGVVNLVLAAVVVAIARRDAAATAAAPGAAGAVVRPGLVRLLLVAAFVTGAASFVYEIAWIRMLSLVLGTSFHAFELMLSAFITGLSSVLVPFLAFLVYKKAPHPFEAMGIAVATVGLGLLTMPTGALAIGYGDAISLCCTVAFAGHILLLGRYSPLVPFELLSVTQLGVTAVVCCLMAALTEVPSAASSARVWGAILFTGILCTAIPFTVQAWAQRHTTATRAALIFTFEPVSAAITSYLVLGETLTGRAVIGALLILGGVLAVELKPAGSAKHPC